MMDLGWGLGTMAQIVRILTDPDVPDMLREAQEATRDVLRQHREGQEQLMSWENEGGA